MSVAHALRVLLVLARPKLLRPNNDVHGSATQTSHELTIACTHRQIGGDLVQNALQVGERAANQRVLLLALAPATTPRQRLTNAILARTTQQHKIMPQLHARTKNCSLVNELLGLAVDRSPRRRGQTAHVARARRPASEGLDQTRTRQLALA